MDPSGYRIFVRGANTLLLLLAIALLAATSSVVKWLQVEQPLMIDSESINFCNVLFVGNFMAGIVALVSFGPRKIRRDLRATSGRTRGLLFLNAVFAVLISALLFVALDHTTVTNVVLLGRFESVAFAILTAFFLRQPIGRSSWLGYGIIAVGIVVLVLTQTDWMLMRGEAFVITAALLQGIAALLSRKTLESCELASFVFVRNLVSAIVFFVLGLWLFGLEHFMHAFGPRLWVMMTAYAAVIVVIGQMAWYRSLSRLPPATVANWSMTSPLLGILFAFLLLGEVPSVIQWIGAAVIFTGMIVTRLGGTRVPAERDTVLGMEKSLSGA